MYQTVEFQSAPSEVSRDAMILPVLGVVSLYDLMHRYRLDMLSVSLQSCEVIARECAYLDILKKPVGAEAIEAFCKILEILQVSMNRADADKSLVAQIGAFIQLLSQGKESRASIIEANTRQIIVGVDVILRNRLFMFVPEHQAPYWMSLEQFGDAVSMFPDALTDMLETGSCYASGRSTACVFHAMRVSEHGLRHIAAQLGVEITEGKKPCPLEFGTWEKVLTQIDNKRTANRLEPKSNDQNEKTRQYAALADTCSHFKDLWRNDTMHSRRHYSMEEAKVSMSRVAEFMNLIAGNEYAPPSNTALEGALKALDALAAMSSKEGEG